MAYIDEVENHKANNYHYDKDLIEMFNLGKSKKSDTHVKMFDFNISPFKQKTMEIKEFNSYFKNPKAEPIKTVSTVPFTNFNVEKMKPIKVENAFPDFKVKPLDHKTPQYYEYNIDKHDLTDIAMKRLDIEQVILSRRR